MTWCWRRTTLCLCNLGNRLPKNGVIFPYSLIFPAEMIPIRLRGFPECIRPVICDNLPVSCSNARFDLHLVDETLAPNRDRFGPPIVSCLAPLKGAFCYRKGASKRRNRAYITGLHLWIKALPWSDPYSNYSNSIRLFDIRSGLRRHQASCLAEV